MSIEYVAYNGVPNEEMLAGMLKLHSNIFGDTYDLVERMKEKPALYINLALDNQQVIGYKMGYALNSGQYYSWLGGIDHEYRKQGIAFKLMEQQHKYLKGNGYTVVRTHTKNKWRAMLLLNIQSGFDVIGTFTDKTGEPKIILEKEL